MTDEALANEQWAEAARENFYEAISQRNWELCRAVLADIEEKKISTWSLRLDMNRAMNEESAAIAQYTPMESENIDRNITNFHE